MNYFSRYQGICGPLFRAVTAALLVGMGPVSAIAEEPGWIEGRAFDVPSGQPVSFLDIIRDEDSVSGAAIRIRFLAPQIARGIGMIPFAQAENDMQVLCQEHVLPLINSAGEALPGQIIVVLLDRPVEHGVADPEATQFFEAYRADDGVSRPLTRHGLPIHAATPKQIWRDCPGRT